VSDYVPIGIEIHESVYDPLLRLTMLVLEQIQLEPLIDFKERVDKVVQRRLGIEEKE
jgi:hypothetical protein